MAKQDEQPDDVLYTYKPRPDEFVTGVPQRDLTREDVERMPVRRLQNALATGLYEEKGGKKKADDEGTER